MIAQHQQQQQQQKQAEAKQTEILDPQSELGSQLIRSLSRLQLLYIINSGYVTLTQDCRGVEGVGTARCCMAPKRDLPKRVVPELTPQMQHRFSGLGLVFHIEREGGKTQEVDFMNWVDAKYPPASPETPHQAAETLVQHAINDLAITYKRVRYEERVARAMSWTETPSELNQRRDVCYTAAKLWGQYVDKSIAARPKPVLSRLRGGATEEQLALDVENAGDVACFEHAIFLRLFGMPRPIAMLSVDYGAERDLFDIVRSMPSAVYERIHPHLPRKSCLLVYLDSTTNFGGGDLIQLLPCPSQYPPSVDTSTTGYLGRLEAVLHAKL
jgi:hypothetical protein